MLNALSGRTHEVRLRSLPATAQPGRSAAGDDARHLPPADGAGVERYVASNEWEGRAGAYAIQGLGAAPRRADRRRLPERRRAAGGAARRVCSRERFPGAVRLRLEHEQHDPGEDEQRARQSGRRDALREDTLPASSVAITIDEERTASTGAAAPCRSASSPSMNEPNANAAAISGEPVQLPAQRGQPDERRVDEAGPEQHEHVVREGAGVLDADPVDERVRGDRRGGRRRRRSNARASPSPCGPAHEQDAGRDQERRRRPRARRCDGRAAATRGESVSTGAIPRVSG